MYVKKTGRGQINVHIHTGPSSHIIFFYFAGTILIPEGSVDVQILDAKSGKNVKMGLAPPFQYEVAIMTIFPDPPVSIFFT
jgi:hypothetical protein